MRCSHYVHENWVFVLPMPHCKRSVNWIELCGKGQMQRKTYVGILNTSPRKGERERESERERKALWMNLCFDFCSFMSVVWIESVGRRGEFSKKGNVRDEASKPTRSVLCLWHNKKMGLLHELNSKKILKKRRNFGQTREVFYYTKVVPHISPPPLSPPP